MNDHIPLRVTVHCRRPNVMAAQAIIRPKLFAAKAHVGTARDRTARLGSRFPFCFRFEVVLARSRTKAARMLRFSVVIMLLFRLETHSCLNKQGVSIGLAVRLVPLIRGFDYSAGA